MPGRKFPACLGMWDEEQRCGDYRSVDVEMSEISGLIGMWQKQETGKTDSLGLINLS